MVVFFQSSQLSGEYGIREGVILVNLVDIWAHQHVSAGRELVEAPELPTVRFEDQAEDQLILALGRLGREGKSDIWVLGVPLNLFGLEVTVLIKRILIGVYLHLVAHHSDVQKAQHLRLEGVTVQVVVFKSLVLVLLILVLFEIRTVEIEEAMTQLVASQCFNSEIELVLLNELKALEMVLQAAAHLAQAHP